MRTFIAVVQFIVGLAAAAAAQAAEPVRVGLSLGLTGTYAEPARMQMRAYRLWEQEVNERGGLSGRPVKMVIVDDESDPARAAAAYENLIRVQRVDLVVGPYSSAITAAVAPVVDKFGYPMLAAGAAADGIWRQGYRNVFGMLTPASKYSVGMLELAQENNLVRVAIVHADDAFSSEVAGGARKWAPYLGLEIVLDQRFRKGTKDLTGLAQRARDSGAELLLVAGHFDAAVNMRRSLDVIGWLPKAYFATIGPALRKYYETLGALAEGTLAMSIWEPHESLNFPHSWEFAAAFRTRYSMDPSYQAATAFAAGQILEAAVERAGSMESEPIREALYGLNIYSVIGRYSVDRTGMQVKRFSLIIQWRKGKKEIVWPKELRSAPPIFE